MVSPKRRNWMALRWSMILTAFAAAFWLIWWWAAGHVPVIKDLPVFTHLGDAFKLGHLVINLPWAIPRWALDVPFVWFWTFLVIYSLTHPKVAEVKEGRYHWLVGLVEGLILGVFCALAEELALGLILGFGYAVITGLIYILPRSAGLCVGFGLGFGAALGLGLGVAGAAIVGFGLFIGPPGRALIIYLRSPAPWLALGRWLMAKDKE